MPKDKGYSSMYGGSVKSTAKKAYGNSKTGNYGKAIGDKGCKSTKGNSATRCAADRY